MFERIKTRLPIGSRPARGPIPQSTQMSEDHSPPSQISTSGTLRAIAPLAPGRGG